MPQILKPSDVMGRLKAGEAPRECFFDAGGVFGSDYSFRINDIVYGTGAGVRFNTPMGPIRLDYGYGLTFPHKHKGILHFAIGQMF